jgi:hypothetical protein
MQEKGNQKQKKEGDKQTEKEKKRQREKAGIKKPTKKSLP